MIRWEIAILLALSLGKSAVYSIVSLIVRLTDSTPLAHQTATLNPTLSERPMVDLTYNLLSIIFALVPVALAIYLLNARGQRASVTTVLGLTPARPARDFRYGVGLAAAVGIPGLAFFAMSRVLGITVNVQASALNPAWWTIPVLVLSAFQNGVLEEVVVVGYLFERTRDIGWSPSVSRIDWRFMAFSSILRGTYHLYQGIGPFFANMVMGAFFAWWYRSRWGRNRILPLVIAHTLIDIVAFVGYAALPASWLSALGIG